MARRPPIAWLLVTLACNSVGAATETGATATGDITTESTTAEQPTGLVDTSTTTPESTATEPATPDLGDGTVACDPWQQDCPGDQKCIWYAHGGILWNKTRCVPVLPDPAQVGEACFVGDVPDAGLDNCDVGARCWDVHADMDTLVGTCAALCTGSPDAPVCPRGTYCTLFGLGNAYGVCLEPGCDLLAQDCDESELCIPFGDGVECVLDVSGEAGQVHDSCEAENDCDPGLLCLPPDAATECDPRSNGCCEPLCDLTLPNPCSGQDQVCAPYFPEGEAPPGSEHVGICSLP